MLTEFLGKNGFHVTLVHRGDTGMEVAAAALDADPDGFRGVSAYPPRSYWKATRIADANHSPIESKTTKGQALRTGGR
jgi:hypothetical protein